MRWLSIISLLIWMTACQTVHQSEMVVSSTQIGPTFLTPGDTLPQEPYGIVVLKPSVENPDSVDSWRNRSFCEQFLRAPLGSVTTPEKRSAEVVLMPDEAKAKALAAQWLAGADWATIQRAAAKEGGTPVEVSDWTQAQIPSPELATAIFAATPGVVGTPTKTALGWYAVKVTHVTPGQSQETRSPASDRGGAVHTLWLVTGGTDQPRDCGQMLGRYDIARTTGILEKSHSPPDTIKGDCPCFAMIGDGQAAIADGSKLMQFAAFVENWNIAIAEAQRKSNDAQGRNATADERNTEQRIGSVFLTIFKLLILLLILGAGTPGA